MAYSMMRPLAKSSVSVKLEDLAQDANPSLYQERRVLGISVPLIIVCIVLTVVFLGGATITTLLLIFCKKPEPTSSPFVGYNATQPGK